MSNVKKPDHSGVWIQPITCYVFWFKQSIFCGQVERLGWVSQKTSQKNYWGSLEARARFILDRMSFPSAHQQYQCSLADHLTKSFIKLKHQRLNSEFECYCACWTVTVSAAIDLRNVYWKTINIL